MPSVQANGLTFEVDVRGEGSPILLIMGIGAQLVLWPEGFCDALADRGFQVIRFDHRDTGRSTWLDHLPAPSPRMNMVRRLAGLSVAAPYTLSDMAADSVGIAAALGHERVHVVGTSMGGMVAQTAALEHPERVMSLASMLSSTGAIGVGMPSASALGALVGGRAHSREQLQEYFVRLYTTIGSREGGRSADFLRELGGTCFDRGSNPAGFFRQFSAILASGSRQERLAGLRLPTLVVHGDADPLIHVSGGRATARAIPGARLLEIPGMGHDLPERHWGLMADAIAANARAAEGTPG